MGTIRCAAGTVLSVSAVTGIVPLRDARIDVDGAGGIQRIAHLSGDGFIANFDRQQGAATTNRFLILEK
ncbi:hypothetical protein [Caballeronia sp. BR00000012568055]|uniref:hypothetical protein n=1 Tax=Caballeronia sp. BR00000012568055 TaxID=2918761 RepID=UPI0023F95D4C|nr:hypothetical protein [Caballeronia sp. BR00000012568055]